MDIIDHESSISSLANLTEIATLINLIDHHGSNLADYGSHSSSLVLSIDLAHHQNGCSQGIQESDEIDEINELMRSMIQPSVEIDNPPTIDDLRQSDEIDAPTRWTIKQRSPIRQDQCVEGDTAIEMAVDSMSRFGWSVLILSIMLVVTMK